MAQAYCVKCRNSVEVKGAKKVSLKNKRSAVTGRCPKCGTQVYRLGGGPILPH